MIGAQTSLLFLIVCSASLSVDAAPVRHLGPAGADPRSRPLLGPLNLGDKAVLPTDNPAASAVSSSSTRRRGPRKFLNQEIEPINPRGACRLVTYTPSYPRYGAAVLCSGEDTSSCLEPCAPGYTRTTPSSSSRRRFSPSFQPLCQATCPQGEGNPSTYCETSGTCVLPGSPCPRGPLEVPLLCPAPQQLLGSCILQEYHSQPLSPKPIKDCKGIQYRDYIGRWRCSDPPEYPPCHSGYAATTRTGGGAVGGVWPWQDKGYCRQVCPPWMVDCGGSCHMPQVACTTPSVQLCPLPQPDSCTSEREAQARHNACSSLGYRQLGSCPLLLRLHGSCGAGQLQVAAAPASSGSRLQQLEGWLAPAVDPWRPLSSSWGGGGAVGGGRRMAAAAGGGAGGAGDSSISQLLLTLRLTMSDGSTHVLGNQTSPATSRATTTFTFEEGEVLTGVSMWSSQLVADAAGLTPPLAGLQLNTSKGREVTVGQPPSGLTTPQQQQWQQQQTTPQQQQQVAGEASSITTSSDISSGSPNAAQGPHTSSSTTCSNISSATNSTDSSNNSSSSSRSAVPQPSEPPLVDGEVLGAASGAPDSPTAQPAPIPEFETAPVATAAWLPGLTLTRQQLGTGVVVGAAAYSSRSHIHSLGLLLLERPLQARNTEL